MRNVEIIRPVIVRPWPTGELGIQVLFASSEQLVIFAHAYDLCCASEKRRKIVHHFRREADCMLFVNDIGGVAIADQPVLAGKYPDWIHAARRNNSSTLRATSGEMRCSSMVSMSGCHDDRRH